MVGSGDDYIERALQETLDSVMSPELRERVVRAALEAESLQKLPTSPQAFLRFLHGPLADAVEDAIGAELAEQVLMELSRIGVIAERDQLARTSSFPPEPQGAEARPVSVIRSLMEDPDDCKTNPYLGDQLALLLKELRQKSRT